MTVSTFRNTEFLLTAAALGSVVIANHDPSSTAFWLGLTSALIAGLTCFLLRFAMRSGDQKAGAGLAAAAFSLIPDGIAIFDKQGCLTANDAAARILGLKTSREMTGLQLAAISLDPQPNGRSVAQCLAEHGALVAKNGSATFEWWLRRTDGTPVPIRAGLVPAVHEDKQVNVCSWQDISALVEMREERARTMNSLAGELDRSVMGIVEAVSSQAAELNLAAGSLSALAEQNQLEAMAVTSCSEQASVNVQSMAAATTELSSAIQEIGRQVEESSEVTRNAVAEAERVKSIIGELAVASQKIGDVVNLINAIASQTNLLALNATIEAARAGEAGKGFAVVAQEVKILAKQTGNATDEIAAQISSVQSASRSAVDAIRAISGTINRISEIAAAIASAVDEQGTATTLITRNVQQASDSVDQVSGRITTVTRASTETEVASSQVVGAARQLSQHATQLKADVSNFVLRIRAS